MREEEEEDDYDEGKRRTLIPRSSSVRSSTLPAMTSHRQSTSASQPRKMGAAALRASMMGPTGTNASYMRRASPTEHAWNVICRQQQPMPKPMASM